MRGGASGPKSVCLQTRVPGLGLGSEEALLEKEAHEPSHWVKRLGVKACSALNLLIFL